VALGDVGPTQAVVPVIELGRADVVEVIQQARDLVCGRQRQRVLRRQLGHEPLLVNAELVASNGSVLDTIPPPS
jgi:hypothetical protein